MPISKNSINFCCEDLSLVENYDKAVADPTQIWDCHHRLEIQGDKTLSIKDLVTQNLYYNRPANELIFLTRSEHTKLHTIGSNNPFYGKKHTEETKQKISESHKGKHYSPATEFKKGEKREKMSQETKDKLRKINKGKHHSPKTEFKKGHVVSAETRMKISMKVREINEKRRNDKEKNNNI